MQTPVSNGFSLGFPWGLPLARLGARAVLWMLASSMGAVAMGQQTAPDAPDGQDTADEVAPERVARLSFAQGGVSLQAVGETAWATATLNRPLTPGDFVRTEADGRAEVQVGEAAIRLGAGTSFAFVALDDDALRMRVSSGVVNLRVRTLGENEVVEVETPQATASILRPGTYRLEVNSSGNATIIKVSSGMLEARGAADQSFVVRAQQSATLTGTNRLTFTTSTLGGPDAFDQWALERDRRDDYALSSDAARHVPSEVVGYEDLDSYGTWTSEPQYGYVWTPTRVVSGWSPYTYGRYSYVGGWGWAWIDDAPWGFAPYHYGNWVTIGSRWCWVPGPRHGRPIGRPIGGSPIGQPSEPRHGWRVPPPPRGIAARSGGNVVGTWRDSRDGRDARDSRDGNAGVVNHGGRFGTVPDGDRYRYTRPGQSPSQPGSAVPVVPPVSVPPATVPSGDDRRMRIPRYEVPQNPAPRTEPRNEPRSEPSVRSIGGRYGVPSPQPLQQQRQEPRREMPRPEAARPSPPPQQQQQQQQQPAGTERPTFSRGGGDRSSGGRPRTTVER